mmetsp:Transcript_76491/g.127469  ORF Transcript_76491/g.127469 Transcript_76491/m.127469 type:complete len:221 (-) Transcript_76491:580-1242(-)
MPEQIIARIVRSQAQWIHSSVMEAVTECESGSSIRFLQVCGKEKVDHERHAAHNHSEHQHQHSRQQRRWSRRRQHERSKLICACNRDQDDTKGQLVLGYKCKRRRRIRSDGCAPCLWRRPSGATRRRRPFSFSACRLLGNGCSVRRRQWLWRFLCRSTPTHFLDCSLDLVIIATSHPIALKDKETLEGTLACDSRSERISAFDLDTIPFEIKCYDPSMSS